VSGSVIFASRTLLGSDGTWILDGNGNWSTATNWSSNPSIPNGQDQTATFGPTTAQRTVTADAAFTVGSLVFNSGVGYTLGGSSTNPLTLSVSAGSSAITVDATAGTGSNAVSVPLIVQSPVVVSNGNVAAGSSQRTLSFFGANSGSGSMTINGPGDVVLGGNSQNWTGALSINGGTVTVNGSAALGSGSGADADATTVNTGGTLALVGNLNIPGEKIILNGGTLAMKSGGSRLTTTLGGPLSVTANSSLSTIGTTAPTATLNGVIGGTGNLQIPSGSFTPTQTNTLSGSINISGGALTVGPTGSFVNCAGLQVSSGVLNLSRPAGSDPNTSSVPLNSVQLTGGTLALSGDANIAALLAAGSTGGAIAVNFNAFTNGGNGTLDLSALPGGSGLTLGTSISSGGTIASAVTLTPDATTSTLRFGIANSTGLLKVAGVIGDAAGGGGAATKVVDGTRRNQHLQRHHNGQRRAGCRKLRRFGRGLRHRRRWNDRQRGRHAQHDQRRNPGQ
jgi:autotransporter-associated beta strand protein